LTAKLYGADMVNRVLDRALQIHGGLGYTRDLPIEHWYRAVRVFRIFEGSDEIQRMTIARNLLADTTAAACFDRCRGRLGRTGAPLCSVHGNHLLLQ